VQIIEFWEFEFSEFDEEVDSFFLDGQFYSSKAIAFIFGMYKFLFDVEGYILSIEIWSAI
jgi:hypothetical protein